MGSGRTFSEVRLLLTEQELHAVLERRIRMQDERQTQPESVSTGVHRVSRGASPGAGGRSPGPEAHPGRKRRRH
jgi:hypothetical protein